MRAEQAGWCAKQPLNTNSSKVALEETMEGFLDRPGWFHRKGADYFLRI